MIIENIKTLLNGGELGEGIFNDIMSQLEESLPSKDLKYGSTIELSGDELRSIVFTAIDTGFLMGYEVKQSFDELNGKLAGIVEEKKATLCNCIEKDKLIVRDINKKILSV